ncbi:hypothetical protein BDV30DRAFT_203880 [Aspergillus minisclerotigenes]|uniref:Uncharacterized protein n=1 Tax=Aspergillus minisclerotigenes TaxID=656917 RepID=A0A5N6JHV0_9EURO|nr:hypothetical protein BDV30DRAFT_203880 [Aspergillus minisclerotigenes]
MQHSGKAQKEQSVINLSIAFSGLSGDIISNYAYSKDHCSLKDIGQLNEIKMRHSRLHRSVTFSDSFLSTCQGVGAFLQT